MYQKYSIGTMAHLMGISAEALRYYESKNIVSPIPFQQISEPG